ncbi:MAG: DegT/DnrJ/EryC1/StrS family aminotransferase [Candidatus Staskawiczbacteria bacterium]|nr:DegT/DnrJ/EryC1/StrS family aminotransferase [Candidatus Staskawiczbacteria bacterium]MBI3337214.1 DegT/DnrJ/EryC1/StrS family aminotransferase [Candidatus Staskawiczbacteria bacterium]
MYKITLSKPDIADSDRKAVLEVLKTNDLSLGKKYLEFEKKIADFTGVNYAVAVNSGTSGLHLIIRALGIGKGDEVITTPFSFISSANCILFQGAKPVFVDIKSDTFNIDVSKIEEKITNKTKAILAVDIFSQPADWEELQKIAKKHNLFLIEDSAEALGSAYKGKKCGSFGDAGVFAFYPNKQITTGEGGVILTNNQKIAALCKSMANQGRDLKSGKWLEHIRLGYNYRLDEMSCALGISQMKRIKEILKKREKVALLYNKKLESIKGVELPYISKENKISWFVYVVKLSENFAGEKRNKIIKKMADRGIHCSNYFQTIHLQPFYREMFFYKEGDFPIAENISKRTLALPFYNNLMEKDIDFVVKNLKACLRNQEVISNV